MSSSSSDPNNIQSQHDKLRQASFEAGRLTGTAVVKTQQIIKEQGLAEKAAQLKHNAMEAYTRETGRNASLDGTILKYSAVATAGAVALTAAPAIVVGAAISAAVVGVASSQLGKATAKYSETTGRDGNKDKDTVVKAMNEAGAATVVAAKSFKEGLDAGRAAATLGSNSGQKSRPVPPPPYA